ncbi:MAG: HlyD family secretion protein [Rhabdochlamydiaceae bacterium]|nr:HlyD family secretion protein [Candidatus Amphrikana amoebophyrae]
MEEVEKKSFFKSVKNWIYIIVVLSVCSAGAYYFWYETSKYVYTKDAQIEAFSVDISPDILARVMTLEVDEGDFVQEGQLISQLQDDILLSKRVESEANIRKLKESIRFQEARFEKIQNDFFRAEQGIIDHVISAQEFDHKQKDFKMAEAELKFAIANLEHAIKQLEVINTKLTHTVITAPMDGMIAKRWILSGDVMRPGQTMFTMYDLSEVWALARLDETKIAGVRVGDIVKIHVDAYPGYEFEGRVFVIKGAAASNFSLIPQDNATGNYTKVSQRIPIKITIDRPPNFPKDEPLYLLPGMSVEVKIYTKK